MRFDIDFQINSFTLFIPLSLGGKDNYLAFAFKLFTYVRTPMPSQIGIFMVGLVSVSEQVAQLRFDRKDER